MYTYTQAGSWQKLANTSTIPSLQQITDVGNVTTRQVTVGGVIFNKATASTVDYVALNIADEEIGRLHCDHTGSVVVSGGSDSSMTGNVYIRPKGITNNSQELVVLRTGDPLFNGNKMWHAGNLPYSKGNWTPEIEDSNLQGTPVYLGQMGYFERIGNIVTVSCALQGTFSTTPNGNCIIKNLPFTSLYDSSMKALVGYTYVETVLFIPTGFNFVRIWKLTSDGSPVANATFGTDLSNTDFQIYFTITYHI